MDDQYLGSSAFTNSQPSWVVAKYLFALYAVCFSGWPVPDDDPSAYRALHPA